MHRNTHDPVLTDMFMHTNFCAARDYGIRTRDLLRSRRVFPLLRQIGRQNFVVFYYNPVALRPGGVTIYAGRLAGAGCE
jgi:hypothetical protein